MTAIDLEAELRRRWEHCGDLFRSPIDGSPLSLDPSLHWLRDTSGNVFPLVEGIPVLMPHVERLLKDHFEVTRRSGPTDPRLLGSTQELLESLQNEELVVYVFGYRMILSAAESVTGQPTFQPGALTESDGQPVIHTADGGVRPLRFRLEWSSVKAETWPEIRKFLRLAPPYFLLYEAFPCTDLVVLYEVLPWIGDVFEPAARAKRPPQSVNPRPNDPVPAPDFVANLPYYRWLFDSYGLDVHSGGAVDIGCGDGFLAAAFEAAGMRHVIGTDLRRPSLASYVAQYPQSLQSLLGMADMFAWCYAPDAFSLINVRNNSALAFATSLGEPFPTFVKGMAGSLTATGLAYVSLVTDESTNISAQFANRPVSEFLDLFSGSGLVPVKLMKLGSGTGFVLVRRDNILLGERVRAISEQQRRLALRDYLSWSVGDPVDVLRNHFLAVADFASEIALAAYRSGKRTVTLWGQGILAYQTWRMLGVQHPRLSVGGLICAKTDAGVQSAFNILVPEEAERTWGDDQLRVAVDLELYERMLAGQGRPLGGRAPDLTYFGPVPPQQPTASAPTSEPWSFRYLSGDHDRDLPSLAASYFTGYLRLLDISAETALCEDFEKRFRYAFPHGCMSIA
jgi:hypothetical protein